MISHGIDTIELGVDIENYRESLKDILKELAELKMNAQIYGDSYIELNDLNLKVHSSGIKFYAYKLSCKDFHIHFCEKEVKNNSQIKVKFISEYLWSFGFSGALGNFVQWLSGLNISIQDIRLSRVDLCVDIDEIEFLEGDLNQFISRARKKTKFYADQIHYEGKVFSGFNFGSGETILARIYNKSLEIKTSQKNFFNDVWKEQGKNNDNTVWRVEFQLRRPALKEFNISSPFELESNQQALWSYLTEKWISIKLPSSDKNVSRWIIDEKWKFVQSAFSNFKGSNLVRKKVKLGNSLQLLDQMAGLLFSLGALMNFDTLDSTAVYVKQHANEKLKDKNITWKEEKQTRIKRFLNAENERMSFDQ